GVDLGQFRAVGISALIGLRVGVSCRVELRAAFENPDGISGKIALLAVEPELEAIGEQLLNHLLLLVKVGLARGVGFAVYFVTVVKSPVGRFDDLTGMDGIRKEHEAGNGLAEDCDVLAVRTEALAMRVRILRLNSSDIKRWMRVRGHVCDGG